MFLISVYLDVELVLLHGECLNEVHMVMKRRTRAVRRQTNFIELACTAVLLVADEHGQRFARCIVPDGLILLHPYSSLLAPFLFPTIRTNHGARYLSQLTMRFGRRILLSI